MSNSSHYPYSYAIRKQLLPYDIIVVSGSDQDDVMHVDEDVVVYTIFNDGTFLTTSGYIFSEVTVTRLAIVTQGPRVELTSKAEKELAKRETGELQNFEPEPE